MSDHGVPFRDTSVSLDLGLLRARPPWLTRINHGRDRPAGAGVYLGSGQVLTCRHVVVQLDVDGYALPPNNLSVTFAHSESTDEAFAATIEFTPSGNTSPSDDFIVLRIQDPPFRTLAAPVQLTPSAAGHRFSAHGFPRGPAGVITEGAVGNYRSGGVVQLNIDPHASDVGAGFSGAPVWDDDLNAVVGLIVSRYGDPRLRVASMLSFAEIAAKWRPLRGFVRWRPELSREYRSHWLPKATGRLGWEHVDDDLFAGFRLVLERLESFIAPDQPAKVLVVHGPPGSGKSSALARTIFEADENLRDALIVQHRRPAVRIDAGISATDTTYSVFLGRLATAVGAASSDAAGVLARVDEDRPDFRLIVDGLDEAVVQDQRAIVALLHKIAWIAGARVVVAVRTGSRLPSGDPLVDHIQSGVADSEVLDLGAAVSHDDLTELALKRLDLAPSTLSATEKRSVARSISEASFPLPLVAQLLADDAAVNQQSYSTENAHRRTQRPRTLNDVVNELLARVERDHGFERLREAQDLLTALAFARGDGFDTFEQWAQLATVTNMREARYSTDAAHRTVDIAGALITFDVDDRSRPTKVRLVHREVSRVFQDRQPNHREVHARMVEALFTSMASGADRPRNDEPLSDYAVTHLPEHAGEGRLLGALIEEPRFLLSVDATTLNAACHEFLEPDDRTVATLNALFGAWRSTSGPARAGYLELSARMMHHVELANKLSPFAEPHDWQVTHVIGAAPVGPMATFLGSPFPHSALEDLKISTRGDGIAVLLSGGSLHWLDLRTGVEIRRQDLPSELRSHDSPHLQVLELDQELFVIAQHPSCVQVSNLETNAQYELRVSHLYEAEDPEIVACTFAVSADRRVLACLLLDDRTLCIVPMPTAEGTQEEVPGEQRLIRLPFETERFSARTPGLFGFREPSNTVVVTCGPSLLVSVALDSGTIVGVVRTSGHVLDVARMNESTLLLLAEDDRLMVRDASTGNAVAEPIYTGDRRPRAVPRALLGSVGDRLLVAVLAEQGLSTWLAQPLDGPATEDVGGGSSAVTSLSSVHGALGELVIGRASGSCDVVRSTMETSIAVSVANDAPVLAAVAVASDRGRLVAVASGQVLRFWIDDVAEERVAQSPPTQVFDSETGEVLGFGFDAGMSMGNPLVTSLDCGTLEGRNVIVSAGDDLLLRVWDCETLRQLGTPVELAGSIDAMSLVNGPAGELLACAAYSGRTAFLGKRAHIVDVGQGNVVGSLSGKSSFSGPVALHTAVYDQRSVLLLVEREHLGLYSLPGCETLVSPHALDPLTGVPTCGILFTLGPKLLAAIGDDSGTLNLIDIMAMDLVRSVQTPAPIIGLASVSPSILAVAAETSVTVLRFTDLPPTGTPLSPWVPSGPWDF